MGYRCRAPLAWQLKDEYEKPISYLPEKFHQIGDGDALLNACLGGMGIVQLPESMVKDHIENQTLVPLLPELMPAPIPLHILWPCSKALVPKVRLLVDELLRRAKQGLFSH